jgi:hypothetical protein
VTFSLLLNINNEILDLQSLHDSKYSRGKLWENGKQNVCK